MIKRLTYDYVKNFIKERGGVLLSKEYVNSQKKLIVRCKKGHIWNPMFNSIQQGSWCFECGGVKRKTINDAKGLAKQKGGMCLSRLYKNANSKLVWKCKNNHTWKTNYNSVQQGGWCPYCAGKNKTIKDARGLALKRNGQCLSKKYINCKIKMLWKCENNHIWKASYSKIRQNTWCPKCCVSEPQRILLEIFKKFYIGYEIFCNYKQFLWLKTKKRSQELDIFIKNKNSNFSLAVEYDGEQHFKPIKYFGGLQKLKYTRKMDILKNQKIKSHPEDVKHFIRIPYWEELSEINIKRLLKENNIPV